MTVLTGGGPALLGSAVTLAVLLGTVRETADPPLGPYVALRIDLYDPDPGQESVKPNSEQRGSGVVVGKGDSDEWLVLTNAHVVDPGAESVRAVPNVFAGGSWRTGRVVAADAEADLALIRVSFAKEFRTADLAPEPPPPCAEAETHGFAGGKKYVARESELRRDLPLAGGSLAYAPGRYFIRTTFAPGESGGAVTIDDRLVALIHGNDFKAGWGICVDQPSIAEFVGPFLKLPEKAE